MSTNKVFSCESIFCQDRKLWNLFQHGLNDRFIGPPVIYWFFFGKADTGTINQQFYNGQEGDAAPHMICDLNGNGIQWSQLRNNTMVKIRTMFRHWPGYEYLYASADGRYFVIILQILR